MSLPQAQKDISEHPAAGSVADPVDKEAQQADIDRKLRLYGIFAAFRQSRMPTNSQIDSALAYLLDHSLIACDSLSPDGQKLVHDSRDIVETLRLIVEEKNADEVLQNFIWHTRDVSFDRARKDPNEVFAVEHEKAKGDAQQAVQHLRTLLSLVLTNSEVRKLMSDFSIIGRDLLARGASKVAETARPDEERLRMVNEPGPEHKFVSEGSREVGPEETPVPEEELSRGATVEQGAEMKRGEEALGETQQEKNVMMEKAKTRWQKEDIQSPAGAETMHEEGETQSKKQRLQETMSGMKESITGRVPQEHKDRASEHAMRVKNFLSDEYFPEERRDQFIFRGKKVIYECQSHDDYQESMKWLINFLEEYATHGHAIASHGKGSHEQLASDAGLRQSMAELRMLLERFANGRSLDTIGDAMHALYDDAQRDERMCHWFRDIDEYAREVLLQPGYVLDDECNERGRELRDYGRQFYDEKYKGHFDNLFASVTDWFGAMAQDPLNKRFGSNWAQLAKDLLFDSEGSLKFKPQLWMDVRKHILPSIISQIGYMPIPRIEYTDESIDLVIENLALSGRNLFPNIISMEARNFMKFSVFENIQDEQHHEFTLTLGQIQADMRDVAFYFRKKTGMPKMSDSGLADVLLGGEGLTVTAHIVSADRDRSSVFKVKDVQTNIHALKFAIRDSKHDALYKMLHPLASSLVKKQLQRAIGQAMKTALEYVDGELVSVRDQMAEAKASEDRSRRQVLKEQLFQRKQAKAEKEGKTGQFKIVTQKEKELLPEVGHPSGWIHRTQERAEAASEGVEWRSEAFNVV